MQFAVYNEFCALSGKTLHGIGDAAAIVGGIGGVALLDNANFQYLVVFHFVCYLTLPGFFAMKSFHDEQVFCCMGRLDS